MRACAFLLAFLSFLVPAAAEEIACEGAFGIDTSAARLNEIHGDDNVETRGVTGPRGVSVVSTTVYPDFR